MLTFQVKTAASCTMVASKNPYVWILRHNMSQNNDWQNSCRLWLRVYPVTVILISWLLHKFDGLLQTLQDWLLQALHCSSADTGPGDNFANSSQLTARAAGTPLTSLTINSLTIFWSHDLDWLSLLCSHVVSSPICGHQHRLRLTTGMMAPLPALQSEQSMGKQVECPHCVPCAGLCVVLQPPLSLPRLSWRWTNGARPRLAGERAGRVQVSNQRWEHWATAHASAGHSHGTDCRLDLLLLPGTELRRWRFTILVPTD